jgi:S-layer protein
LDTGTTFTGGAGDDAFTATAATLTINDSLDGGAGANTLTITDVAAGLVAGTPAGLKVANIQTATVTSTGAVGSASSVASTSQTAAVAQDSSIILTGTYVGGDTIYVTIGATRYTATAGSTTTVGSLTTTFGRAEMMTAITDILTAHVADSLSIGSIATGTTATGAGTSTVRLTAKVLGTAIPVSLAAATLTNSASATVPASVALSAAAADQAVDVGVAYYVANVIATAPVAIAETQTIALVTAPTTGNTFTLSVNGADYKGTYTQLATQTVDAAAADVAAMINAVLGAGSATSALGIVTVKSLTAGTALPMMNLISTTTTDTFKAGIANAAAMSAAVSASAFDASGFTGLTQLTTTSVGGANISAAATTNVTESNTGAGNITVAGGLADTVTGTTNSVYVSGAAGAVKVTTSGTPATGFYIASSTTTGQKSAWGTSTANKAGVVVTGGTTVNVKEAAATITSNAAGTVNSTDVRVGSDANVGITVANTPAGKETIRNLALDPTGDVVVDVSNPYTNVSNLSSVVYGTGAYSVYTNGATTASISGGSSVVVKDVNVTEMKPGTGQTAVAGTSKLTTVNLNGLQAPSANASATLTSDALTNVKVVNSITAAPVTVSGVTTTYTDIVTINNTTANHNLALTVGNVGYSATSPLQIADSVATSVSIASEASAYAAIKTTAINSGSKSFLYVNAPQSASITMTNGQSVDLGDLTQAGYAKVATVDGSAAAGAIAASVGAVPKQGLTITTGAGKDSITLLTGTSQSANSDSAKTLTVSLGAGDDSLLNGGTTAHTMVGATFDGGAGNDTVGITLVNVGTAAKFTNFEYLGLDVASASSTDISIMSGITGLNLLKNSAGVVTYQNVTTALPLTVSANMGTTGSYGTALVAGAEGVTALSFPTAVSTGSADAYSVTFNGTGASTYASATAISAGTIDITGVEAVTIASNSSSGFTSNSVWLMDADVRTITATGSQDLSLKGIASNFGTLATSTNGKGVSTVDASAMTGKFTFDATTGYVAVTNTSPADTLVTAYAGTSILGGSGNDTITLGTQALVTVNGGAGDDSITTSTAATTLTGGDGIDTFNVSKTVTAVASTSSAVVKTTITDAAKGDKIVLPAGGSTGTAASFTKVAVVVDTADALAGGVIDAYDLAVVAAGSGAVNNAITWFQLNGNTYIVDHVGSSTTVFESTDVVVKLAGLIDLSKATWVDGGATGTLTLG